MSKYVIEDTTLTAIGDAIRSKDGTTEPILVSDFASKIAAITTGGGSGSSEPSLGIKVTTLYENKSVSTGSVPRTYTYQKQEDELGIYVVQVQGYEFASATTNSSTVLTAHLGAVLITPTAFYNLAEGVGNTKCPFYREVSLTNTDTDFTVSPSGFIYGDKGNYSPEVKVYALLK